MTDVKVTPLSKLVASSVGGGTPARGVPMYWGGDIPWASVKDLTDTLTDLRETQETITGEGLASSTAKIVGPGTVIVAMRMAVGRCAMAAVPVAINQDLRGLVPKPERVTGRYLLHAIKHLQTRLESRAIGSTVRGISSADLLSQGIFAPSLSEQGAVAEILDRLDEVIAKAEELITKLQQLKQGLLHDLLTRGIDANGELGDPQAHPDEFMDSPFGLVRSDWEIAPLKSYGSAGRPYLKTGPFGSNLNQAHWEDEGVPVITIGSLGEGMFTQSELLHVSERTAKSLAAYAVVPGDVVFSRVADVGRSAVVRESERGWIMSSNLMWMSVDRRRALPDFLQANLAGNPGVRRQIRKLVNSSGRDVANAATVNTLLLPWPPLDEQRRITAVLGGADSRIEVERRALIKLCLLRQGLADDLLTGRARVTELLRDAAA